MKETQICQVIRNWLQIWENQGKLLYIRNNSGATITHEYMRKPRFWRSGKPGSPDFLIFIPCGRTLHVEVKNDTGTNKQSFAQMEYERKITSLGHDYYIVRSLNELEGILRQRGAI